MFVEYLEMHIPITTRDSHFSTAEKSRETGGGLVRLQFGRFIRMIRTISKNRKFGGNCKILNLELIACQVKWNRTRASRSTGLSQHSDSANLWTNCTRSGSYCCWPTPRCPWARSACAPDRRSGRSSRRYAPRSGRRRPEICCAFAPSTLEPSKAVVVKWIYSVVDQQEMNIGKRRVAVGFRMGITFGFSQHASCFRSLSGDSESLRSFPTIRSISQGRHVSFDELMIDKQINFENRSIVSSARQTKGFSDC